MASLWWRLVRLAFRLLYNELAWTYDLVSWLASLGNWRAWQLAALPYLQGRRILEIAHGPGHMLLALRRAEFQVLGLDLSAAMTSQARRRLRRAGVRAPLLRASVFALPLAEASFDSVLSTFPTDFIAEPQVLENVYRTLRPGGRFIVVPEGHLSGTGFWARFLGWLYTITGQRWPDEPEGSAQPWLANSPVWSIFEERMRTAGFQVQLEEVRLANSAASVIVATKPAGSAAAAPVG